MSENITTLDEFEQEYSKGLGISMTPRAWRTVTEEWLGRFSEGAGDYNPLFRDPGYASTGSHHGLVASPAFIFSVEFGANASIWGHIPESRVSMNDLTILYIGNRIEWFQPIWVGDRLRPIETPTGIERTTMRQVGEALICTGTTEYWNSRGELVARLTNKMLRFANQATGVESSDVAAANGRIAPDPLVWSRTRRGAKPRYWDMVSAGEQLTDLPKGTYTTTELYNFSLLALGGARAAKVDEGTIDMGAGGRADPEYARKSRAQAASFDFGPQRTCWLIQAVTDWAGDDARLISIETRLKRPNLVGDTNTVRGQVLKVYVNDAGASVADVEVENVNQDGTVTASGVATVALPVRDSEPAVPELLFTSEVRGSSGGAYG